MKDLPITYQSLCKPKTVLIAGVAIGIFYNAFIYLSRNNLEWISNGSFSWFTAIKFVVIDQIFLESITIGIVSFLIILYAHRLKLNTVKLEFYSIGIYFLKFLPLFLVVFFFFNPITQSLRYLLNNGFIWDRTDYFEGYFYSKNLYLIYLFPISITGYGLIAFNFFQCHRVFVDKALRNNAVDFITVVSTSGLRPLKYSDILYFEKIDRKYYVYTQDHQFKIHGSIKEMEEKLVFLNFFRVNRSVIVNIDAVDGYSYWESDKYILRLKSGKEFVMPRPRLKKMKERFLM